MIRQLAFDLPVSEAMTRADFLVAPSNALALAMVEDMSGWPQGRLVLIGPEGSGKTHLAHVWAAGTGGTLVSAPALSDHDIGLLAQRPVALDDTDRLAGDVRFETALFHLLNFMGPDRPLLLTAQAPPRDWGLHLADVMSRLQASPLARLEAPDDALLSAVLVKLFADRQVAVAPNLIPYLVGRMPRHIAAAQALVAELDRLALAEARPITRALAGAVLDSLDLQ